MFAWQLYQIIHFTLLLTKKISKTDKSIWLNLKYYKMLLIFQNSNNGGKKTNLSLLLVLSSSKGGEKTKSFGDLTLQLSDVTCWSKLVWPSKYKQNNYKYIFVYHMLIIQ